MSSAPSAQGKAIAPVLVNAILYAEAHAAAAAAAATERNKQRARARPGRMRGGPHSFVTEQWSRSDQVEMEFEQNMREKIETQVPRIAAKVDQFLRPKLDRNS